MALRKLLVANRGEIAVRIIRAARELGIGDRAAVSATPIATGWPCAWPTRRSRSGRRTPRKSYLNIEAMLRAARETGADAVHPGYGFLAENAGFADAVEAAGLVFVGPTRETIRTDGRQGARARGRRERPACRSCRAATASCDDLETPRPIARRRSAFRS